MSLPPMNALKAFEAAGRHLNFGHAAVELGVTQGAVAQQIRALEARLGAMLFHRLPRGLALTEDGRRLHAPLVGAFDMMREALTAFAPDQSILALSVPPSFATKWLVPRLGRFAELNPDIDVRIVATETVSSFRADAVDIAVRYAKPPFAAGLEALRLSPAAVYPVCSPDLKDMAASNLAGQPLLHDSHGLWPLYFERVLSMPIPPGTRSVLFSQTAHAIDAARQGQGVALASDLYAADDVASGALCRPIDGALETDLGFYVVFPRDTQKRRAVTRMRDWLETETKETLCL